MAKSKKKVKHMKTGAIEIELHFKGKRPELHILFPTKTARQLYKRLHNRFGK